MSFFRRKNDKYDLSDVLDDGDDYGLRVDGGDLNSSSGEHGARFSHAITPEELLQNEGNGGRKGADSGTAAEALRNRVSRSIEPEPEPEPRRDEQTPPTPQNTAHTEETFDQLLARLRALVDDAGKRETAESPSEPETPAAKDVISEAERRAKERADAIYKSRYAQQSPAEKPAENPSPDVAESASADRSPVYVSRETAPEAPASEDVISEAERRAKERADAIYKSRYAQQSPAEKPAENPSPDVAESASADRSPVYVPRETAPEAPASESVQGQRPDTAETPRMYTDWYSNGKDESSDVDISSHSAAEKQYNAAERREAKSERANAEPVRSTDDLEDLSKYLRKESRGEEQKRRVAADESAEGAEKEADGGEIKSESGVAGQAGEEEAFVTETGESAESGAGAPAVESGEPVPLQVSVDSQGTRVYDTSEIAKPETDKFPGTGEPALYTESMERRFRTTEDGTGEGEEPEYPGDYTGIDEAPQHKLGLLHSVKRLGVRTGISAICTLLLLLFTNGLFVQLPLAVPTRTLLLLGCLAFLGVACSNILKGIASVFRGAPDVDFVAALAYVVTVAHTLYFGLVRRQAPAFYPEAAIAFSMTVFEFGKWLNARRVYKNFCKIATTDRKNAVCFITGTAAQSIAGDNGGEPANICTGRRTTNLLGFFKYTYSRDRQATMAIPLLVGAVAATALVVFAGLWQIGGAFPFTAAVLTLSLFAAPATVLVSVMPLKAASKVLDEYDAMMPGIASAEKIRESNVIAVDAGDLFPVGSVKLYNMYTLSKNPVDRSLCEAAAVVMAVKSPLREIFTQITGSVKEKLPKVDSILYEERLGLSGWVEDRRVLIGNRTLMANHNVKIPSYEVDKKILARGFFPVYIAADSQPCVLLVVGYNPDESVTYEMRRACNAGYSIIVNNSDPNITSEMLIDYFGLPDGSVKIMNSNGAAAYRANKKYAASAEGAASYDRSVCGLFALATASVRVPSLTTLMTVLNTADILIGLIAFCVMIFTHATAFVTAGVVFLYQLVSTLVMVLVPVLYRP